MLQWIEGCIWCVFFFFELACWIFFWIKTQKWNHWVIRAFYFSFFEEFPYCFIVAASISNSTNSHHSSLLFTSSPRLAVRWFTDDSHSYMCQVMPNCVLICISSMFSGGEQLFMSNGYLHVLLKHCSMSSVHFLIGLSFWC